jgi:BirA family transcriptional regulator, biotin operon repressor / biotin---[acetyl-CoA-carboxylase] ligase
MQLLHLPRADSTMEVARQLVHQGDRKTQAVLTDFQTHGRGRLGRVWRTFPAPYSMACTYIAWPGGGHLPLVAALAVHEAIVAEAPHLAVGVKWPNDVQVGGQKVAGVLCESCGPEAMLVGIGLNLLAPEGVDLLGFPGAFLGSHRGNRWWAEAVGACFFNNLALYQGQGWAPFHKRYAQVCTSFGQVVTWRRAHEGANGATNQEFEETLTGHARGLTKDGHLELVADDGKVHIIHSGEIVAQARP